MDQKIKSEFQKNYKEYTRERDSRALDKFRTDKKIFIKQLPGMPQDIVDNLIFAFHNQKGERFLHSIPVFPRHLISIWTQVLWITQKKYNRNFIDWTASQESWKTLQANQVVSSHRLPYWLDTIVEIPIFSEKNEPKSIHSLYIPDLISLMRSENNLQPLSLEESLAYLLYNSPEDVYGEEIACLAILEETNKDKRALYLNIGKEKTRIRDFTMPLNEKNYTLDHWSQYLFLFKEI